MSALPVLFASIALALAAPAIAQINSGAKNVCIGDQFAPKPPIEFGIETFRFPVGCELIDCCPGCPAGGPLDIEVRISGAGIRDAEVHFGDATLKTRRERLAKGRTSVKSVPATTRQRVVTGELRLAPDAAYLKKAAAKHAGQQQPRELATARVEIAQMLNGYTVQENRFSVAFHHCGHSPAKPRRDEIELRGLQGNQAAVTLIDARQRVEILVSGQLAIQANTSCTNDWQVANGGLAGVGNLIERDGCNSEVAVFSRGNAFYFLENLAFWTLQRETLKISLDSPIKVPLTVWIVAGSRASAEGDVAEANRIFSRHRAGFELVATYVDASNLAAIWPPVGQWCTWVTQNHYASGQINAYYIDEIPYAGAVGYNCGPIFVDTHYAGHRVLAHEIGHSMGLAPGNDHYSQTNSGDPNPQANLMFWADGGDQLTLGQAFRINMESWSDLNRLNLRTGPTRDCHDANDAFCPGLGVKPPEWMQ